MVWGHSLQGPSKNLLSGHQYYRVCCFGCLKDVSKSVQVLFNGIEALMVLTLTILRQRALCYRQISPESRLGQSEIPDAPCCLGGLRKSRPNRSSSCSLVLPLLVPTLTQKDPLQPSTPRALTEAFSPLHRPATPSRSAVPRCADPQTWADVDGVCSRSKPA